MPTASGLLILRLMDLSNKNYLIVGGSSGIGRETASRLVKAGANVTVWARREKAADQPGDYAHYDVTGPENGMPELPESLDGLVYAPGTIKLASFRRLETETFLYDYQVNVLGAIPVIKAALKPMQKAGGGSIVFFSTVAVQRGLAFHASIAAAKGAVEGLTRSLAAELAPYKIRVNCVAPSLTATPLAESLVDNEKKREASAKRHPLGRYGEASDIAPTVMHLLSPEASWVTGAIIPIDGGLGHLGAAS